MALSITVDDPEQLPEISVAGSPPLPPPRPADLTAATDAAQPMSPSIDDGDNRAVLVVNGERFDFWTTVQVRRDYGKSPDHFEATIAEPTANANTWAALKIKPGDRAAIYLDGTKAIDGYVTTRAPAYDEKSHVVRIMGASKTCDLIPTSAKPGEYRKSSLQAIANGILSAGGFPIKFILKNPPPDADRPIEYFGVHHGESPWEAIERLCRMRGVYLSGDTDGNLVGSALDGKSAPVADLQEGGNILAASGVLDDQRIIQKVYAVGQDRGSDDSSGKAVSQVSAIATNPTARPWREKRVLMEEPGSTADAQKRADFEIADGIYTSVNVIVVVQGWKRADGRLWDVSDSVNIASPMLFPDNGGRVQLGIRAVTFQQANAGTTTVLELCLKTALGSPSDPNVKGDVPNLLAPQPTKAVPDPNSGVST